MLVDELGDEHNRLHFVAKDKHRGRLARPPLASACSLARHRRRVVSFEGGGTELIEPFEHLARLFVGCAHVDRLRYGLEWGWSRVGVGLE